jgi:hypothetical protein
MSTRDGGCFCGAIRYRLVGEPLTLYACHCTDCQRQTGSSFSLSMVVFRTAIELLRGEPRRYEITTADGRLKNGRFCGTCSSRVWVESVTFPDIALVEPGTLDDTTWIRPVAHIWTRSAQPWISLPEDVLRFETRPDDPMVLVNAWRDQRSA